MSYTKHNYQKGDELLASQLNEMDDQIALNEETAGVLVTVSNTEPQEEQNRVWVKATSSEVEIPTMDDFDNVSNAIRDLQDPYTELTVNDFVVGNWENRVRTNYSKRLCIRSLIPVHAGDMLVYDTRTLLIQAAIYKDDSSPAVSVVPYTKTLYEQTAYMPCDGLMYLQLMKESNDDITLTEYDVTTLKIYNSIRGSIESVNSQSGNIKERAFVSSYNSIPWEDHARNEHSFLVITLSRGKITQETFLRCLIILVMQTRFYSLQIAILCICQMRHPEGT